MRKILLLLLLASAFRLNAQTGSQTSFKDAVEYNDYIVNKQTAIGVLINDLMTIVNDSTSTLEQAHKNRTAAIVKMSTIINDIRSMPDWKGNTELRDVSINLFSFYRSCFENEYKSMIDIVYKTDATDDDFAELDRLLVVVTEKEKPLDDKFAAAQSAFAKANGFTLTPAGE